MLLMDMVMLLVLVEAPLFRDSKLCSIQQENLGQHVRCDKIGTWRSDSETKSSNYRELNNLVEETEAEARAGNLSDSELFLFTDNSTTESAF